MAEIDEQPRQGHQQRDTARDTQVAEAAARTAEVAAHALAGAVLELQRLTPAKLGETGVEAPGNSSGSCGTWSCFMENS